MTDSVFDGKDVTTFVAGDRSDAGDTVGTLASDLGFEPVVSGHLAAAIHPEHLA